MTDSLQIGPDSRCLRIEVTERERDGAASTVRVALTVSGELLASLHAGQLVSVTDGSSLASFLEDIAELHWTGWTGTREWIHLEADFWIDATWHRTGGAALRVTVRNLNLDWLAEATIEVDDMELERLGPRAREVLLQPQKG